MKKLLIIIILFLLFLNGNAQSVGFSGNIYGFFGEKVMLLKKASKNLGFEGPLSGVQLQIKGPETNFTLYSDITGTYEFSIPKPGSYTVTVLKEGYSTLHLTINYKDAGAKSLFSMISFVIRKDDNSENNFGNLSISESGALFFSASLEHKNANKDVMQSNKILFEKSVSANNSTKQNLISVQAQKSTKKIIVANTKVPSKEIIAPTISIQRDSALIKHTNDLVRSLNLSLSDTSSQSDIEMQIELAKQLLSTYNEQDPNYEMLLNQIKNAESQLALKENFLLVQKKELSQAKKVITFTVSMIVIAVLLIGLMFYYINEKRKFNKILTKKNAEITKINDRLISSITYASVIQSNLLMDKEEIKKLFPNSFVYYQPKDILSGDFYWFGKTDDSKIIISADCTGHGVPGALLSVLGHGIIEELIEKNKLTSPSLIISELNNQLKLAFSTQNLSEYGIELTVMCFNDANKKASFASNGNGVYKYSDNEIINYLPLIHRPDKNNSLPKYEDVAFDYKANDCFYLMSDGFCDQFKGGSIKPQKYNLKRFETLISKVSSNNDLTKADQLLNEEFNDWKGEKIQTDDVLVVGFRV